jgi:exopolysaccharide production protein ExoQ
VQASAPSAAAGGRRAPVARSAAASTTANRLAFGFEAGLDAAALLFFPLLVLVPRGIAPLVSVAGAFAAGLVLTANPRAVFRRGFAVPALLLVLLLFWGMLSAIWSVDPLRSLDQAGRLGGIFAAGLALAVAAGLLSEPRRLSSFQLTGLVLAIAMAIIDLATQGALSKHFSDRPYQPAWLNQASVAFAVLLLPTSALPIGRGQRIWGLLLAAAGAATICALAGTAAKAALAAGVPIALLCYWRRARVAQAAAVLSVLVIITAPLTFARLERVSDLVETAAAVKFSAGHRLLIWSFVGDRIAEHPLAGWGLDSSRAIPGGKDPIEAGATWLPLHPHNAPLQLWLELGVPGAVMFALLAASTWLALGRAAWPRRFAAAAGGVLATGFVASLATYGIWQEWWQGTLWFSLFLVLVMARMSSEAESPA